MKVTNFDQAVWIGRFVSDPPSPQNGQMWYNTTDDKFRFREDGITVDLNDISTTQPSFAYISDTKGNGSNGGTFTAGSFVTRTLNTVHSDPDTITSLASNQITLQDGTYLIYATAPAFRVDGHKVRLQNITDAVTEIFGQSSFSDNGGDGVTHSELMGQLIVTGGPKVYEVQHRCATSMATNGLGVANAFGVSETYTKIEITKLP